MEVSSLQPADVQAALDALGVETQIIVFEASTATAPLAAQAIGTELGSIIKSLCFTVMDDPVLVLTAGDQRVDDRKLSQLFGVGRKKVKIANAETTLAVTGFAPGGVAPVGHRSLIPILIDQTLSRFQTVYGAAGTANTIFPISFDILVRVTGGRVVDVVKSENGSE